MPWTASARHSQTRERLEVVAERRTSHVESDILNQQPLTDRDTSRARSARASRRDNKQKHTHTTCKTEPSTNPRRARRPAVPVAIDAQDIARQNTKHRALHVRLRFQRSCYDYYCTVLRLLSDNLSRHQVATRRERDVPKREGRVAARTRPNTAAV